MLSHGIWKYIGPTSLGSVYAIVKMLSIRALDYELAIAHDFTYQFLAGILLGFSLRPVVSQIYWKRITSILFFLLFLLILGPFGQLLRYRVWGISYDDTFWLLFFSEIIASFAVSILATILLPFTEQENISIGLLWKRCKKELHFLGFTKIFGCSLLYALSFVIFQSFFDESISSGSLVRRMGELLSLPPISSQERVLLLLLQGTLNILIMLPLFIFFHREKMELIVVLGSLSFIVAVFSPAFANFQRIEPLLLFDQVFIGFCLHFVFVTGSVFCFGRNKK